MRKTKPIISFDKSFLRSLINDENSCVELQEQKYHLALHPYHLTNINNSIKDILGQGIAKYNKKLKGILLGYENIKLLNDGTIMDDSFFVHIDVIANFFLFKPELEKVLIGVVNKKSQDHVGCLVYETFNVSIPKPEDEDISDWIGSTVEIGEEISFKITFLKLDGRLPYIRGEFVVSIINKEEINNDENTDVKDHTLKKKVKKKSKKRVMEATEDDVAQEHSPKKRSKKEKKDDIVDIKKSKRKSKDVSIDNTKISSSKKRIREESNDSIEIHRPKKKLKKSCNEKFENTFNSTETHEDIDILNDPLQKDLINGELENYEHVKKKKKKHKTSVDKISNNYYVDDSKPKKMHKDSEIIDNDSPKKKKKKKKDNFN